MFQPETKSVPLTLRCQCVAILQARANKTSTVTTRSSDGQQLTTEINDIKRQADKLYEAVEKVFLPLNASLQERVHNHDTRRQEILVELASLRRQKEMPLTKLGKKHIAAFCSALKEKLLDRASNFGKEYLKLLVIEIRMDKKEVHLSGSFSALAGALSISTKQTFETMPIFVPVWLPKRDAQQNFFAYNFGFRMTPLKKNHPRTEHLFHRVGVTLE